jgi:hypothetical protein
MRLTGSLRDGLLESRARGLVAHASRCTRTLAFLAAATRCHDHGDSDDRNEHPMPHLSSRSDDSSCASCARWRGLATPNYGRRYDGSEDEE